MVAQATSKSLGIGLYTPAQAAHLARVPVQTITRWVHGNSGGRAAIRPQLGESDEQTITFLDFVQAMAIRSIRLKKRVPLNKIRECVDVAAKEYHIEYPFAHQHQTYLFDDDVVLRLPNNELVQITGKYKHNDLMHQVAEVYIEDLHFNSKGLAERYTPMTQGRRHIVIDPKHRFGHPIVMPCGYSVAALRSSVDSEGSVDAAAKANAVAREDVLLALRYEDMLAGAAPRETAA